MKVGLFFGSFNPIHSGHLIIANHILEFSNLDRIWFIVSPQNPFKKKGSLIKDHHRLEMVNLAIEKYPKFKASNIEFNLPKPSYTIDTLAILQEKYPENNFVLIMGEDNINTFHKWKNFNQILNYYEIYTYPRINTNVKEADPKIINHSSVKKIDAPVIEISSTMIRKMIKENKNIRPLVSSEVFDYLDRSNLYK